MSNIKFDLDDILSRLDLEAIEDSSNKLAECEYFFGLASAEKDRAKFRWLTSALLSAAYSFFETSALRAYFAFTAPDTGEPIEDDTALRVLRTYVGVKQRKNNPDYIETFGKHPLTKQLYELRRKNTHHFPLSITAKGSTLPEDFSFGSMKGEGVPALQFCREVVALIRQVQGEL